MTSMLSEIAAAWADRWRHPDLVAMLSHGQHTATVDDLANSILCGLAAPVSTIDAAVRRLADAGEYWAVQDLTDEAITSKISQGTSDYLWELQRNAGRETEYRHAILAERAKRAGADVIDANMIAERLANSLHNATAALDQWEEAIKARESARAAELEALLAAAGGGGHQDWAAAVRACIDAGQFPAAQRRIEAGPDDENAGNPVEVPRSRERFPWNAIPLDEILAWYLDPGAEPRPEFLDDWQPRPDDQHAWRVLNALQEFTGQVDAATVRLLAEAIDALIGAEGGRHTVKEHAAGHSVELSGLHDHRLARLGVQDTMRLWIGSGGYVSAGRVSGTSALVVAQRH